VFVVSKDFLTGGPWEVSNVNSGTFQETSFEMTKKNVMDLQQSIPSLERLSAPDCVRAYSTDILSDRKNLLAVTSNATSDNTVIGSSDKSTVNTVFSWLDSGEILGDTYWWLCSGSLEGTYGCDYSSIVSQASNGTWMLNTLAPVVIEYCLSERVEERCRLQFNLPIMIVVIICNLGKATAMLLSLWKLTSTPLATIGDAAASFLDTTDDTTSGLCLSSKKDFPKGTAWTRSSLLTARRGRQTWKPARALWYAVPGGKRWLMTIIP
jgi:hypothetical protein